MLFIKKNIPALLLTFSLFCSSQQKDIISWINKNSIIIENANPDKPLQQFKENCPSSFKDAKIFGFGEASHNTKEFFNIKAKFFKYLVEHQGVRAFIMEDAYQAEYGINRWILGGEGNRKTIANNFNIGFWYTKEIVDLLEWMRNYNLKNPDQEPIRFYGMDIQAGKKLNIELRELFVANNINIQNDFLKVLDESANYQLATKNSKWLTAQLDKLKLIQSKISNTQIEKSPRKLITRKLNYLKNYIEFASLLKAPYPKSTEFRDIKMFENVKWIINNKTKNRKAFIWAHNEHINKKEMYYSGSNIKNLGRHLKDFYKEQYYSVGFDFGTGKIDGYVTDKPNKSGWETYTITKPFRRTYAYTLNKVEKDIYFLDLQNAKKTEGSDFFTKKNKHLLIAANGYQPKPLHKIMIPKIFSETYDALIFVKNISRPEKI